MSEPVTTYKTLIVPNTGDLVAAWGTSALNPNFQLIDSMFGGVANITLSGATTVTLSVPPTNGIWNSSTPQSSQALISLAGTPGADASIVFTLPGYYIVVNNCDPSDFVVKLTPAAGGNVVCAPQGRVSTIFLDSSGISYVDLGEGAGSAMDLHGWQTVPRWISQCTFPPYLLKDGASYSTSLFRYLAYALKGSFGNSDPVGVSFFVPDEMARARIAFDKTGTGRLTSAVSGVNGATMGSAGGNQSMASHQHANSLNDPGHLHAGGNASGGTSITVQSAGAGPTFIINGVTGVSSTGIGISNATTGSGSSQNVQPSIVSFLPLIRTY